MGVVLASTVACTRTDDAMNATEPEREPQQEVGQAIQPASGQPVVAGGVRFEAWAESAWRVPARGEQTNVALGLRVTNNADEPVRFFLLDTLKLELTAADGEPLRFEAGRDVTRKFASLSEPVAPGKSLLIRRDASLRWTSGGDGALRLEGSDGAGGIWYFDGLREGTYRLAFAYASDRTHVGKTGGIWKGTVVTPPVDVVLR